MSDGEAARYRASEIEPLLTVGEVCRWLGIPRPTLYRLIRRGKLQPVYVGSRPRFISDDVWTFIRSNGSSG
jgi:excisionase family DNA binding protein